MGISNFFEIQHACYLLFSHETSAASKTTWMITEEGDIGVSGIAILVNFSCGISVILILNCVIAVFSESAGWGISGVLVNDIWFKGTLLHGFRPFSGLIDFWSFGKQWKQAKRCDGEKVLTGLRDSCHSQAVRKSMPSKFSSYQGVF